MSFAARDATLIAAYAFIERPAAFHTCRYALTALLIRYGLSSRQYIASALRHDARFILSADACHERACSRVERSAVRSHHCHHFLYCS